ncbi:hypothetical protein CLUG_05713 [Clavispora lusitaniae ATCC 42720]|uniref:Uncharacterized protein n=1 Tax=Clavispora lusitaniae (strain ATCC 42720) TaxID=306902 RepID=C4YBY5_CLAL4|nr:uncharacterized protein CLUG_05713 [Clavispora lusitaniae ATCC 42720]EEQ41585.1 hypothetical protein CLUG_05713 [Clavispora lusitaniae ATCC 42720]
MLRRKILPHSRSITVERRISSYRSASGAVLAHWHSASTNTRRHHSWRKHTWWRWIWVESLGQARSHAWRHSRAHSWCSRRSSLFLERFARSASLHPEHARRHLASGPRTRSQVWRASRGAVSAVLALVQQGEEKRIVGGASHAGERRMRVLNESRRSETASWRVWALKSRRHVWMVKSWRPVRSGLVESASGALWHVSWRCVSDRRAVKARRRIGKTRWRALEARRRPFSGWCVLQPISEARPVLEAWWSLSETWRSLLKAWWPVSESERSSGHLRQQTAAHSQISGARRVAGAGEETQALAFGRAQAAGRCSFGLGLLAKERQKARALGFCGLHVGPGVGFGARVFFDKGEETVYFVGTSSVCQVQAMFLALLSAHVAFPALKVLDRQTHFHFEVVFQVVGIPFWFGLIRRFAQESRDFFGQHGVQLGILDKSVGSALPQRRVDASVRCIIVSAAFPSSGAVARLLLGILGRTAQLERPERRVGESQQVKSCHGCRRSQRKQKLNGVGVGLLSQHKLQDRHPVRWCRRHGVCACLGLGRQLLGSVGHGRV